MKNISPLKIQRTFFHSRVVTYQRHKKNMKNNRTRFRAFHISKVPKSSGKSIKMLRKFFGSSVSEQSSSVSEQSSGQKKLVRRSKANITTILPGVSVRQRGRRIWIPIAGRYYYDQDFNRYFWTSDFQECLKRINVDWYVKLMSYFLMSIF